LRAKTAFLPINGADNVGLGQSPVAKRAAAWDSNISHLEERQSVHPSMWSGVECAGLLVLEGAARRAVPSVPSSWGQRHMCKGGCPTNLRTWMFYLSVCLVCCDQPEQETPES